jgi:uncharacterized membrane protein YvbJ
MVYCTKCGTKNPDDASICSNCGAPLNPTRQERRDYYRRHYENECFGIPHGGAIVGAVIGLIILLAGLIPILQYYGFAKGVSWWALVLIIFGVLIVIGAVFTARRRY